MSMYDVYNGANKSLVIKKYLLTKKICLAPGVESVCELFLVFFCGVKKRGRRMQQRSSITVTINQLQFCGVFLTLNNTLS